MKIKYNILNLIYLLFFLFSVGACSSGGDSGSSGGGTPPTKSDTSINGAAVKGIIKNGLVEIFAITNGQVASQPIATTETANDGSYSFTLDPNFSGPVLIVVRDNASGSATMKCDNFFGCQGEGTVTYNFGDDVPLGDTVLKSLISNVTGGNTQTGAVTPFTHMAAAYAEDLAQNGGYSMTNIDQANSQVGNLLGINNIVTTVPPDVSQLDASNTDVNAMKYAFLSAAIVSLAEEQYSGNIAEAINALLTTFTNNNGQLISLDTTNDINIVSLEELARHAAQQAGYANIESRVSSDLWDLTTIAQASVDEPTSAKPSPTSGLGDLDTVKAFVSDVRTWGNVINNEIEAQTTNSQFKQQMEMAEITANTAGPLLGDAFEYAVIVAIDVYTSGNAINDLADYFTNGYNSNNDPNLPPPPNAASGSATISVGNTVVVDGVINGVTVDFTVDFPADSTGNQFILTVTNSSVQNNEMRIIINSGDVTINYDQAVDLSAFLGGDFDAEVSSPDSASMNLDVEIGERNVNDPIIFTGNVTAGMVAAKDQAGGTTIRDIRGDVVYYNPSTVDFTGEFGNSSNTFNARIAADMPNAETFMPLSYWLENQGGSYSFSDGGDTLTISTPNDTITYSYITDNLSPGYQKVLVDRPLWGEPLVTGMTYASLSEFLDSNDPFLEDELFIWYENIGGYNIPLPTQAADWNPAGGSLDAILDWSYIDEENASNFREISNIVVTLSANLENLPPASISLTGNRTALESGNATITIAYDARRIEATVTVVNGEPTGNLTITNQDGVVITYRRDDINSGGEIIYDQTKYADIEEVNGITLIRYIDGYFESM